MLFFSASASKLIPYILPSIPPLALLLAYFLADAWEDPVRYHLNRGVGWLGWFATLGAFGVPIAMLVRSNRTELEAIPWYLLLMCIVAVGGFTILYFWRRNRPKAGIVAVLIGMSFLLASFSPLGTYVQRENTIKIGQWLAPQLEKDDLVFVYNYDQLHDFPLHLKRFVGVVALDDDTKPYGLAVPKEHQFGFVAEYDKKAPPYVGGEVKDRYISIKRFQEHLRSQKPVFVLISEKQLKRIYEYPGQKLTHWRLIKRADHFALFGNQAAVDALKARNRAPEK